MSLIPHKITNYTDELRDQIIEGEGFESKVYYNDGDTPTIGYGLALYDKTLGTKVSTAFSDIEKAGITISAEDNLLFGQIETAMQATPRNDTTINNLVNKLTLDLGDEATGQVVFSHTIGRYEEEVKNKIGDTDYAKLEGSKELIALVDIAYNGGSGLLGSGLRHALAHDNRAEVWFQIRYDSNGGQSRINSGKGIANRRVAESDVFGLYDETPSAEGMKDIIRMARLHATEISDEESAFPVIASSPSANPYAGDNGIEHQIQAAKDYLVAEFGKDVKIDGKVIVGNDSINDNSANRGRTNINDIHLNGSSKNDLIFGENGDDTLRGKAGDDVLYGGDGKDKLYGGSGNDIYIAGTGDTINDSDNQGKVYFDATLLSGIKHKVSENVYEDAMFTYTKEANNLHIAQKEDPSKSVTIEHWNSKTNQALGIELSETKEQTQTKKHSAVMGIMIDPNTLHEANPTEHKKPNIVNRYNLDKQAELREKYLNPKKQKIAPCKADNPEHYDMEKRIELVERINAQREGIDMDIGMEK